jgi:arsenate reductase (thioredoxin)
MQGIFLTVRFEAPGGLRLPRVTRPWRSAAGTSYRPLANRLMHRYNPDMKTGAALVVVLAFAVVAARVFVARDAMSTAKPQKTRILFLCTGNSCRSQMAEGWARALRGDSLEPFSAGIEKHGLNSHAVTVMREAGVDISSQRSKTVDELPAVDFDIVVTVCDNAAAKCPTFPAATHVVHVPFDDPPKLAADAASEEETLGHYRRVRDEIREFVAGLPESLPQ